MLATEGCIPQTLAILFKNVRKPVRKNEKNFCLILSLRLLPERRRQLRPVSVVADPLQGVAVRVAVAAQLAQLSDALQRS